jgi:hypothetical protein
MSVWNTVLEGLGAFAEGCMDGLAEIERAKRQGGLPKCAKMCGLCASLGWQAHEEADGSLSLYFSDAAGRRRRVSIVGDNSLVLFVVYSESLLPAAQVPQSVGNHLLVRNHEALPAGAWAACVKEDGTTVIYFRKFAFADGLTAQWLKQICEGMVGEVCTFDGKLRQAGLLANG